MTADATAGRPSARALVLGAARELFPGYFALVMATGVVSIACQQLGLRWIAVPLVGIAWAAYLVLWGLTILRAALYPQRIALDFSDHQRAPGFFTIVAGTCVLGTQSAVVAGLTGVASALWVLGLGLWFGVMYAFFTAVTIRARKPSLAQGINGAWLIAAVATQSVVVLKGTLGAAVPPPPAIQFLCLAFFMIGCMLYLAIIPLIFYPCRYVITSTKVTGWPQYTIDVRDWRMGAEAAHEFAFKAPAGATKVEPKDLPDFDELAGIYFIEGAQ